MNYQKAIHDLILAVWNAKKTFEYEGGETLVKLNGDTVLILGN